MTSERDHLRQYVAELGSGPNLNRLNASSKVAALSTLLKASSNLKAGDHVAVVTGKTFEPRFGVVDTVLDGFAKVAMPRPEGGDYEDYKTYPLDAFSKGWRIGDRQPRIVPVTGPHRKLADRLLRSSRVNPGRFMPSEDGGMSRHVVCELREEAAIVGHDLGFAYPGRVAPEDMDPQGVLDVAKALPGSDGETTDSARGFCGWGPYEDYAKTMEIDALDSLFAKVEGEALSAYDFYFSVGHETASCPCCAGSGRSRDFKELQDGFYACGEGRWGGWGERLYQNEIDALVAEDRIDVPEGQEATETNYRYYLGRMGHDEINRWIVTPLRAARLGIRADDCADCGGEGRIPISPNQLTLNVWAGFPDDEVSVVFTVVGVDPARVAGIKAFMAAHGATMNRRLGALADGAPLPVFAIARRGADGVDAGWASDSSYPSWPKFAAGWGVDDLNLPVGYSFSARDPEDASLIAHGCRMAITMAHPRKGAARTVFVESVSETDRPSIIEFMAEGIALHARHFEWAAGEVPAAAIGSGGGRP